VLSLLLEDAEGWGAVLVVTGTTGVGDETLETLMAGSLW
jgi:hypothetical protein